MKHFVLVVCVGLGGYLLWQTHRYSVDLPFADDYAFVPHISGEQSLSLQWLWEPHNEHRMVIPKLVNVVATRLGGQDFRVVAHISSALLVVSALLAVMAIARSRGRYALEDILIAATVCTWSQAEAVTWTSPFNLVATTAFLLLWWVAASADRLLAAAIAAFALALTGASGVAALAGVVPWFIWRAYSSASTRGRVIASCASATLVAYGCACVVTHTRPGGHPASASVGYTLRFFVRLVSSPFTFVCSIQDVVGLGVLVILAGLIALTIRDRPSARQEASVLALAVAGLAVAGAVAVGRAGFGTLDIASRYITLATPLAVAVFALAASQPRARIVIVMLATILVVSAPHGDKVGHSAGKWLHKHLDPARRDIEAGVPLERVVTERGLYPEASYAVAGLCALAASHGSVFADPDAPSPPECSVLSPSQP